jgi:hypothetical protein
MCYDGLQFAPINDVYVTVKAKPMIYAPNIGFKNSVGKNPRKQLFASYFVSLTEEPG